MEKRTFELMYEMEKNHWWFHARRDLILSLLPTDKNIKILDLGAGTGLLSEELSRRGYPVKAVDKSEEAAKFCLKRGIDILVAPAENLPFTKDLFDVILMLDVLEHTRDDAAVIREVLRVLKPGGRLILTVPAFEFFWSKQDELLGHFRRYTAKSLKRLFGGWHPERLTYFNFFLFVPIWVTRRIPGFAGGKDEIEVGGPFFNKILYPIFYLETRLLKFINFPFGVSCLGIFKKEESAV